MAGRRDCQWEHQRVQCLDLHLGFHWENLLDLDSALRLGWHLG